MPSYLAGVAITAIDILEDNPDLLSKLNKNISTLREGLSAIKGLEIASDPSTPSIVYLRLTTSRGSSKSDLQLLEEITYRALKEESVLVVTSKRATLDKCNLPVGVRLYVSAKASDSLKRVAALVLTDYE